MYLKNYKIEHNTFPNMNKVNNDYKKSPHIC